MHLPTGFWAAAAGSGEGDRCCRGGPNVLTAACTGDACGRLSKFGLRCSVCRLSAGCVSAFGFRAGARCVRPRRGDDVAVASWPVALPVGPYCCSRAASAAARWCIMCSVASTRGDMTLKGSGRLSCLSAAPAPALQERGPAAAAHTSGQAPLRPARQRSMQFCNKHESAKCCPPGRAARDACVATRDGTSRVGAADAGMGTRVGGPMLPSRRGVLSGDLMGSCLRTTGVDCPTPDDGRACTALNLSHRKLYPFVATCCAYACLICLYISVRTFFFCQDAVLSERWC